MQSFSLGQVVLKDAYMSQRQEKVRTYLEEFDEERLLYSFRVQAGMRTDAEPLGGWEKPDCLLRGHFTGHFLSACAKFAYGQRNEKLKEKACRIIDILEECAQENGFLSAFGEDQLELLEEKENTGVWAPYYTLDKILKGLVDCARYMNNRKALKLAENLAVYIYSRFQKLSYWKIDNILRCTKLNPVNEFGGIGHTLYFLWELSKKEEIWNLAILFDRDYWIENLAAGKDVLEDLHANTHLPMVNASMKRYSITREEKYREAAIHFYHFLLGRTFANGNSSSRAEHFLPGGVSQQSEHWGASVLDKSYLTGGESESCCAHNTEILLSYLIQYDEEHCLEYLNHLESLKYNAVLNCASQETGLSQYHQPMGKDQTKHFSSLYDDFWCCTGSGVEAMAGLQNNIWFRNGDTIFLNMFVSSVLNLPEKNVSLELITDYPESARAILKIHTREAIHLKIAWKANSIKNVNGLKMSDSLKEENGFIIVDGVFSDGEYMEIDILGKIRKVFLGKEKNIYCMMYDNILLALTDNKFIPLYQIEQERYTVYLNSEKSRKAKDGSKAYMQEEKDEYWSHY